jgi:hypothetical protein
MWKLYARPFEYRKPFGWTYLDACSYEHTHRNKTSDGISIKEAFGSSVVYPYVAIFKHPDSITETICLHGSKFEPHRY